MSNGSDVDIFRVRIGELLDLKKEDVHLEERYFDVVSSKTQNGIRKVPIAEKVYPFYKSWFEDTDSEYLIHRSNGEKFKYDNYHKTLPTFDGTARYGSYTSLLQIHMQFHDAQSRDSRNHSKKDSWTLTRLDKRHLYAA